MAGWDVTVLTPDKAEATALRILGARPASLEAAFDRSIPGPRAAAVAVEARLCETEPRVGVLLRQALRAGRSDIRVWGSAPFAEAADPVRHRLSHAARAFKSHALAALTTPSPHCPPTETFHRTPAH
ncbi:hypothetical protein [Actinocorallia sp. A-T 12471]|uniref:hypothetical protein n=1 Tax=Actinocorallia sp. A-T 12471 TaxID=3089813 RepID=UPI0029D212AA|nr:hypothetical protein [Actinocorallia sp. A-T 12471]MDX6741004.1 hypothetical protein [Actinocorallia sp. A-T 12471]